VSTFDQLDAHLYLLQLSHVDAKKRAGRPEHESMSLGGSSKFKRSKRHSQRVTHNNSSTYKDAPAG